MSIVRRNAGRIGMLGLITEIIRQSASELSTDQRERLAAMAGQLVRQGAEGLRTLPSAFSQLARQLPEHARAIQDAGRNIINAASDGRLSDDGMRSGERGIVRSPEGPLTDLTGGEDMEIDGEGPPEAAVARIGAGGGGNPVSKETPISSYPSLSYGLQETHTTILPWTGWVSVPFTTTGVPTILELRMNTPYDFFVTGVTQVAANVTPAPIAAALYNKPMQPDGTILTAVAFPQGINNGTAVEQPAWRQFWGQLYEYYTVLGCEYKITIINPVTTAGASGIIGQSYESYSTTAGATGNTTPTSNLYDMMALKGMQFTVVDENGGSPLQNRTVIQGRYKPGQAHRNIVNDGDVKTWTKTDFDNVAAGLPTLTEILRLYFWRGALATTNVGGCNMQIELKYIVQFKDLRANAKWPVSTGAGANIVTNLTPVNTAIGTALQRWN